MWDTSYLSVFSPNAGKYGPEKTSYLDTFHAMFLRTARFLWKIHFCPKLGPFCNFVNFFSLKKWKAKVLLILDISLQTPCLVKFLFWSYCLKCSWLIRLQDSVKYNISKKMEGSNWFLCLQINIRISYKLVLLLLVNVRRHVQSTKITSLQHLCNISRKKWGINTTFAWR